MQGLTVKKTIELNKSADDWQLYTSEKPDECASAASQINTAIEQTFNNGSSREEVEKAALAAMRKFDRLGAADSEPLWVLSGLLDELFGNGR